MQCRFREKFLKDLSKIKDQKLLKTIKECILIVEEAESLTHIKQIKKLTNYNTAFRIRIGDYRIGIFIESNSVEFTRILHRREIYRHFP